MNLLNDAKMLLVENRSAKALRNGAKILQNDDYDYGCFIEDDDGIVLFGYLTDGLSYLPNLYKDVTAECDNVLCVVRVNDIYYWVLILDKYVVQSFCIESAEIPLERLTMVKLQLNLLKSKDYRIITNCSVVSEQENSLILIDGILRLPFENSDVLVKPELHHYFSVDQLEPVIELKKLSYKGVRIETRRKLGLYLSFACLCFVGFYVVFNAENDVEIEGETSISTSIPENVKSTFYSFDKEPEHTELVNFYTKTSRNPFSILKDVSSNLGKMNLISGWVPIKYQVTSGIDGLLYHSVTFRPDNGVISDLSVFSIENGWRISLSDGFGTIIKTVPTEPLFNNWARFHVPSYEKYLSDAVSDWWDNTDIEFFNSDQVKTNPQEPEKTDVNDNDKKQYVFRKAVISIPNIARGDSASLGSLIKGTPLSFESLEMHDPNYVKDNGTFNTNVDEQKITHDGFNLTLELMIGGVTNR